MSHPDAKLLLMTAGDFRMLITNHMYYLQRGQQSRKSVTEDRKIRKFKVILRLTSRSTFHHAPIGIANLKKLIYGVTYRYYEYLILFPPTYA